MTIISPSLLACDFLNIKNELSYFENEKNIWLHLDIMDGHFVPNLTFGQPIIKLISQSTSLPLDAHLMVTNPEFYIDELKNYHIHNFTFHYESLEKGNILPLIKKAKQHYPSVGISLKPNTNIEVLSSEILKKIDLILIMSVEPGFGGQSFIETSLPKIIKLKKIISKNNYGISIQVDGGICLDNNRKLINAGADNLVAGSSIFKNDQINYKKAILNLRS